MAQRDFGISLAGVAVFDAPLAKELIQQRFPTGYLGVRRLRPSSRAVARVVASKGRNGDMSPPQPPPPIFKVKDPDTGEERRMNSQEKKAFKRELLAKRKLAEPAAGAEPVATVAVASEDDKNYMTWTIDSAKLEEEIADLRGEREGVPPVYIPPPLAAMALSSVIGTEAPKLHVVLDDEWAQNWAIDLKKSMKIAEDKRDMEEMRPMPYHLVPEVWKRMRPSTLGQNTIKTERSSTKVFQDGTSWTFCELRQGPPNDEVTAIIQLLHDGTSLHIACGAKFGCEYLLYDGPRSERHAFAGVRFGLFPDAYELSGYVRCLNTAGKLALLAAAKKEINDSGTILYRVAIVDLALVKIVETTFKKPKKTMEQRLQNLSKATS